MEIINPVITYTYHANVSEEIANKHKGTCALKELSSRWQDISKLGNNANQAEFY